MLKAGRKIVLKGRSIRNVKGILVAPTIDIQGLLISANKPISKEVSNFLAKHHMEVQQIVEDGDKLVRLTGGFTVSREVFKELESAHISKSDQNTDKPPKGIVAATGMTEAQHDVEVEVVDIVIGGGDDAKTTKDVVPFETASDKKSASEGSIAVHFQRQLEVNAQEKRVLQNMQSAVGATFNNSLLRAGVALGPKAVVANQSGKDLHLPEAVLQQPGQKFRKFGFKNGLIFTDLNQKIVIKVPNEFVLEGEFASIMNTNIGYLTEMLSGDIHSTSGKTVTMKDCLIRVKDSIVIESEEDIHIEMDPTVIWGNKSDAPSLTVGFQAFQSSVPGLLNKTKVEPAPADTSGPGVGTAAAAPAFKPGSGSSKPAGS